MTSSVRSWYVVKKKKPHQGLERGASPIYGVEAVVPQFRT